MGGVGGVKIKSLEEERIRTEIFKLSPRLLGRRRPWPLRTRHIRLKSRISVLHTTKESMLNPRPARMPETRERTPGSFWTRRSLRRVWESIYI